MRILFSVHLYPPTHNCGGEYYIHNLAKWLISQGHQCRVLLHQARQHNITQIYVHEGVEVFPPSSRNNVEQELYLWCEIAITHLEYTASTIGMSQVYGKPVCQIVHNDTPYECVLAAYKDLNIIYNSHWIAKKLKYKHRSMVMPPPVDYRRYDLEKDTEQNKFITLINMNDNKGGKVFRKIAAKMPDRQFLGVVGSYDDDHYPGNPTPNLTVIPNTSDILPVYANTRILLMPSEYESWGMTATEAMCNGIPVICTRTPGLLENTDRKMVYCERDDIDGWVSRIKSLDNKEKYNKVSNRARVRSRELDPMETYKKLEEFLYGAV